MNGLPWDMWGRQAAAIVRLELRKSFRPRRAWWVFLLAFGPAFICFLHGLFDSGGHRLGDDTKIFGGIFQIFYLRFGIYFGCVGIFMNLIRGDVLEKTLHYYFLAPARREVVLAGKFITGLIASTAIFCTAVALAYYGCMMHFGAEFQEFFWNGPGRQHMSWYVITAALACLGYGAIFVLMGLLVRNPMIPAAVVMVWEGINIFLPSLLQKMSVTYWLRSLLPVTVPPEGPLALIVVTTDPAPAWVAILGLAAVSSLLVFLAARRVRTFEISYVD